MAPEQGMAGLVVLGALTLAGFQAGGEGDVELAREVLARMQEVYASCSSYSDSGEVRTTYSGNGHDWTTHAEFSTAFVRPRDFRFEYSTEFYGREERHMVWRGSDDVLFWTSASGDVERVASLDLALAGATGISSGSAHTVPSLLLPEVGGRRITEGSVLGHDEAEHEGVTCIRVRMKSTGAPTVLWIEKERYLLRRVDEVGEGASSRSESTTTYRPELGAAIPASLLAFEPPPPLARSEPLAGRQLIERAVAALLLIGVVLAVVIHRTAIMARLRQMRDEEIGLR